MYDKSAVMQISEVFVWDPLTCWQSKNVLKKSFLESGLTKSLTICNFGNHSLWRSPFFPKFIKFDKDFRNGTNNGQKVFVFKVIAFESGAANSHNPEQDTSHRQSMC